ncbi:hypothetical protein G9C85_15690 [Halorubellus sp. JP-L1]|uniref:hypothetical protein n=1 Tax=Halorubellus sp. JP-L1 TaxID=2715753 RepID=UPI00140A979C|nr:hypothetical protein [Halorubellus sp. JP-L1]NHN43059.1 hypothetical protein [Halorubellus sp. JP-L1]
MADTPPPTPDATHERVFERIWTQLPEQQNRTSSSWWFFILFPEGDAGYGPRQLMFSIAARVGDRIRVNDVWLPGMDLDREIVDGVDEFDAISVGWDGDDERVDERIVNQPARATLSRDGSIEAWTETADGERRGSEISASEDRPLGLDAEFVGEKGAVEFEAWGDLDSPTTAPVQSMAMDTPAGGVDVVAFRQMRFEGEFDLPAGREQLEGACYFQRVCFNVPLFPWKWIWAVFPDGGAFSAMIPFVGPHVLREGYGFYDSETLERASIPVRPSAFWSPGDGGDVVEFDDVTIEPVLDGPTVAADGTGDVDHAAAGSTATDPAAVDSTASDAHPDFAVEATTDDGEFVEFRAETYGHARNHVDRPILGGRLESHWSYNEYMFQMTDLDGRVGDSHLSAETVGDAYGTLEYSTGLGL